MATADFRATSGTISSVQCLRGIAALMVVVFHLGAFSIDVLAAGVDIFFVISGFIMWVTTAAKPDKTPAAFLRDRVARIVPLYWAVTALLMAVLLIHPQFARSAVYEPGHALKSFLFIAAENPAFPGDYTPLVVPGWTLNYEMFFYLVMAAAIWWGRAVMSRRFALVVTVLGALVMAGWLFAPTGLLGFYTYNVIVEFLFGAAIGVAYMRKSIAPSRLWWLVFAAGVLLLVAAEALAVDLPRSIAWGVPAAAIVMGAVFSPPLALPWIERLGDWSYSLYLTHPSFLSASRQAWKAYAGGGPIWIFYILAVFGCVAGSGLIYRYLELPLTRRARTALSLRARIDPLADPGRAPL